MASPGVKGDHCRQSVQSKQRRIFNRRDRKSTRGFGDSGQWQGQKAKGNGGEQGAWPNAISVSKQESRAQPESHLHALQVNKWCSRVEPLGIEGASRNQGQSRPVCPIGEYSATVR
jgi:hypothetical protein